MPGQRERPEVPETATEQDATVQGLAEVELADLDAQPADIAEDEASDSTDEDYQPSPGIGLLGLTTTRPVALVQHPTQTQPWWLFLRG
jgi:hypothetical protein